MSFALVVLAIFGFLAVFRRSAGAFLHVLGRGVESFTATQETSIRERRGDLTGLREAEVRRQEARRARRGATARLAFWCALLIAPLLTPWTTPLYATLAMLWLLPSHRTA